MLPLGVCEPSPLSSRGGVIDFNGGAPTGRRERDTGFIGTGVSIVTGDDGTGVPVLAPSSTDVDELRVCAGVPVGLFRPVPVVMGFIPPKPPVVSGLTLEPVASGLTPAPIFPATFPVVGLLIWLPVTMLRIPAPVVVVLTPPPVTLGFGVVDPTGFGVLLKARGFGVPGPDIGVPTLGPPKSKLPFVGDGGRTHTGFVGDAAGAVPFRAGGGLR